MGKAADLTAAVWSTVDEKDYYKNGKGIVDFMGDMGLINLDQQVLQNLGLLGGVTGAVGGAADLTGGIWGAADKKSYDKHGKGIVGGISKGAGIAGAVEKHTGLGKKSGVDNFMGDMGFINLEEQGLQNLNGASHAIIATPE